MQELFAVTLNKRVTNKVTGKKQAVQVKQPRDLVEYTLAKKLSTMLPIPLDEAQSKLMKGIKAMDKNQGDSILTIGSIVQKHPLEFKLVNGVVYHAR